MAADPRKSRATACVMFLLWAALLSGCSPPAPPKPLYGPSTPLAEGQAPLDALCGIQSEFAALPAPLMQRLSYRPPWTTRRLGATPTPHRGFHRVHLRDEGLAFAARHARLELVAALVPEFADPARGGEAAALLAGIPAGDDAAQGTATRALGALLHETGYRSPERSGRWHAAGAERFGAAAGLYGLGNATSQARRRAAAGDPDSLEAAIVAVLKDWERLVLKPVRQVYEVYPEPPPSGPLADWVAGRAPPGLAGDALTFLERHPNAFAALVVFPTVSLQGSGFDLDEQILMWLLGLEARYWPAMLRRPAGNELLGELLPAFRAEAVERIHAICARRGYRGR